MVGGRGREVGTGGSRHFGPAKVNGLELERVGGVTDRPRLVLGSDLPEKS